MTVLLGRTTAGTTADFEPAGTTVCWPFVAAASGDLAVIFAQTKVNNATATGIRLGIYTDSAGSPSALLAVASVDSLATARTTAVFQATLGATVAITSGVTYHLGWFAATEQFDFQGNSSGAYKADSGADFVNPFVTATTGTTDAIIWGEDVAPAGAPPRSFTPIPFM